MKYIGTLIRDVREFTNNAEWAQDAMTGIATAGIHDRTILKFFNDCQIYIQSSILNVYPHDFVDFVEIPIVANQEAYVIPARLFADNRIISVEFSYSGEGKDYEPLRPRTISERNSSRSNWPLFYIRTGNTIRVNPVPQLAGGKLRVTYYRKLDNLDLRRGTVAGSSGRVLTISGEDSTYLSTEVVERVCACDRDGNVLLRNFPVGTIDAFAHTITAPLASQEVVNYLESGVQASDLVGAYLTCGKDTRTHSELPDNWEVYLTTYAQKRILTKDSSVDLFSEDEELKRLEKQALENYAKPTEDVIFIPILDEGILL